MHHEGGTPHGRYARLMKAGAKMSTRRQLPLGFTRPQRNPRVLVAKSLVGREGLNLRGACWVNHVGSHLGRPLYERSGENALPRIEIGHVISEGTFDAYRWKGPTERWGDLHVSRHGIIVPHHERDSCKGEEYRIVQVSIDSVDR